MGHKTHDQFIPGYIDDLQRNFQLIIDCTCDNIIYAEIKLGTSQSASRPAMALGGASYLDNIDD